jgi:hypothetical protein
VVSVLGLLGEPLPVAIDAGPEVRWFLEEPLARDYDNVAACGAPGPDPRCSAPLEYRRTPLPQLDGQCCFDAAPLVTGPGTRQLVAVGEREHRVQLVVRRDDTYVGLVSELVGVPFALWPRQTEDGAHQTDARISADCVSTVIYGRRRLGEDIPYVSPRGLLRFTEPVPPGEASPGDVLHFGFQTAVLAEDTAPLGVPDDDDRILHAHHALVEETVFGALPYRDQPYTVRRFTPRPAPSAQEAARTGTPPRTPP